MKYRYTTYLPDTGGRFVRRPMVEIEIFGPSGSQKQLALVDSGADRSLFSSEIAEVLGINLSRGRRSGVTGITGRGTVNVLEVEIRTEHLPKTVKIPVGFIDSPYVGALLGQEGFFDLHRIKFERDHDVFEINPVKK